MITPIQNLSIIGLFAIAIILIVATTAYLVQALRRRARAGEAIPRIIPQSTGLGFFLGLTVGTLAFVYFDPMHQVLREQTALLACYAFAFVIGGFAHLIRQTEATAKA